VLNITTIKVEAAFFMIPPLGKVLNDFLRKLHAKLNLALEIAICYRLFAEVSAACEDSHHLYQLDDDMAL
jgi:hypothetical protein